MRIVLIALALSGLTGCAAKNPGTQSFVSATWAKQMPSVVQHSRDDPGYLVLKLASDTVLAGDEFNALYAHASRCSFDETREFSAFGPFTAADEPQELPHAEVAPTPEGKPFDYLVYIPTRTELWNRTKHNDPPSGVADLTLLDQDICVRLIHTAMPKAQYSTVARIPASAIAKALSETPD